jgi:hypothetical protein
MLFLPVPSSAELERDTAALVAGRPTTIASSIFLVDSDARSGCGVRQMGPDARLTATFAPPSRGVGLVPDSTSVVDVPIRPGLLSAHWHVFAPRAGVSLGRIVWRATAPDGSVRGCPSTISLRIVAASGPPTLRAVSAARFSQGDVVVLRSRLPGLSLRRVRSLEYPSAFDAFFTDHFERVHVAGEAGRRFGDAFFPSGRSGFGFGDDGRACVAIRDPHRRAALRYRIRFTWNHELGARTIRARGSLPVAASVRTRSERSCAAGFEALTRPVEGD